MLAMRLNIWVGLLSDMLLNIAEYVGHIIVICWILQMARVVVSVVICTASVSVAGRGEFHVHDRRLIGKVFWFPVVLWWSVRSITHQVSIWKAIIVHIAVGKFLLICMDFVEFWAHMSICVSSSHLTSENVPALSGRSRLSTTTNGVRSTNTSLVDLSDHLHLIWIIHDEFFGITSVDRPNSTSLTSSCPRSSRYDLALRCNCWNLIVILLNRW